MLLVFDKSIYLQRCFCDRHREDRFSDLLADSANLVVLKNQGMSFRKAVQPIGRGLLFSYPLIKVYQSLPNGMKDDGTRSFLFGRWSDLGCRKTCRLINQSIIIKKTVI